MQTYDLICVKKPDKLPFLTKVKTYDTVDEISYLCERNGKLEISVYPKWHTSKFMTRKLAITKDKNPSLPFKSIIIGKIQIDGNEAYAHLEESLK